MSKLNNSQLKPLSPLYKSSRIFDCLLLLVLWLGNSPWISAQAQKVPEDASGTLVMVARTGTVVIVSVDSEVHAVGSHSEDGGGSSDGNRKLVSVGEKGACAIDGYLGKHGVAESDVSGYLRGWVKNHPTEEPSEGIDGLLHAAATAWNDFHPGGNRLGGDITYLTCGDIEGTQPVIVRGRTDDSPSGYVRLPGNDILYVSGVLSNQTFRAIFENPSLIEEMLPKERQSELSRYLEVGRELASDRTAEHSYAMYLAVSHSGISSLSESAWNISTIQSLFSPIYKAFEENFREEVGPPNNVRIITPCGRIVTTVEANPWPTCP